MGFNAAPVDSDGIAMYVENDRVFVSGNIKSSNPNAIMEPFINQVHDSILENNVK